MDKKINFQMYVLYLRLSVPMYYIRKHTQRVNSAKKESFFLAQNMKINL